jgi:hypothetical protein
MGSDGFQWVGMGLNGPRAVRIVRLLLDVLDVLDAVFARKGQCFERLYVRHIFRWVGKLVT